MRWRPFHIALLIFQTFWLNVVIPGHTRGAVSLPGTTCESCRQPLLSGCSTGTGRSSSHTPVRDPASHCAICYFAARLTLPPVVDFTPPRLGLAEILDPPAPQIVDSLRVVLPFDGRAPPSHV